MTITLTSLSISELIDLKHDVEKEVHKRTVEQYKQRTKEIVASLNIDVLHKEPNPHNTSYNRITHFRCTNRHGLQLEARLQNNYWEYWPIAQPNLKVETDVQLISSLYRRLDEFSRL